MPVVQQHSKAGQPLFILATQMCCLAVAYPCAEFQRGSGLAQRSSVKTFSKRWFGRNFPDVYPKLVVVIGSSACFSHVTSFPVFSDRNGKFILK
jgi:hypothetical protein